MAFSVVVLLIGANLAQAQSGVQVTFTPDSGQKFDARSTPAKDTSDDLDTLRSKGYMIGSIRATQAAEKWDPETTRLLVLQKAAEVGGDFVAFTKKNVFDYVDVTGVSKIDKSNKAHCVRYGTQVVGYDVIPMRNGPYTKPIFKCEYLVVDIMIDEGLVWRYYDPTAEAPVRDRLGAAREAALEPDAALVLAAALIAGDMSKARALVNADPSLARSSDKQYGTPLLLAVQHGTKDMVELLLAHGADVNSSGKFDLTALHFAKSSEMAEVLLAHGANVNARDSIGSTPLHDASNRDVAEVLLAHGADINAKRNDGATPLHDAAISNKRDVTEVLLAHGADVNAKNMFGQTPLLMAAGNGNKEVVELLLAHGADVNSKSNMRETPLGEALRLNHEDVVDLLRQHGADIARKAEPEEAQKAVTGAATAPSMLGKNINSAEMKTWLSSLGKPEILRSRLTESYYYNFKSKGISLFFNNANDTLRGIIFYSEGADDYRQFQGDLPFGLSFQNTRSEIESILGPPDKTDDGAGTNIWTSYNSKGIRIKYNTVRTDDMNARMYFIIINTVP
jgi:ankyrin repeat protein